MNSMTHEAGWKDAFTEGLKSGIPIGLGYFPVSFTFGFLAVSGGLPVWVACLISLTNLTSAGQFAGTNLILAGAGYLEVALATFVINLRYMLMSFSLSQRLEKATGTLGRMALAFGITDETFVVSSLKKGSLRASYMIGLMMMPILGWNLGTLFGGSISTLLPQALQCDGDCAVRHVHRADYSGGAPVLCRTVRDSCGGGNGMPVKIYPGVWLYFIRLQGDRRDHSGLGSGSGVISKGGRE